MTDIQKLIAKLNWMLQNQNEIEEEFDDLMPWNSGYREAVKDMLHYLEHNEDD